MLPDGGIYKGYILNGIPEGEGEESHPCGDSYRGEFHLGVKNGQGEYKYANN